MRETTRVLVVEDDADALLLLRLILGSRPGYEVVFCRNPAQALAVAPRRRFDVLVTDLHLPGMDGLELAAALRETDPTLPSSSSPPTPRSTRPCGPSRAR